MKKLISIFITIVFIFTNIIVYVNAEQENTKWNDIYRNFINSLNKEEVDGTYFSTLAFYDIDNNSIPELIINKTDKYNSGNDSIKIYSIENSNIKEIFSYTTDLRYCNISASDNKLYYSLILEGLDFYECMSIERYNNVWKVSEVPPEDFYPVDKWYRAPVSFIDFNDEYAINTILSEKKSNNCFSFDLKYIEEYPQISSPEISMDSYPLEDNFYVHEIITQNSLYEKDNKNLLMINGTFFGDCDVIEENGKIFVPLRAVFEKTGKTVDYDSSKRTIKITGSEMIFYINLDEKTCSYKQKDSFCALVFDISKDLINKNGSVYISLDSLNKSCFQLETGIVKGLIDEEDFDFVYIENIYQCDFVSPEKAANAIFDNFAVLDNDIEEKNKEYDNFKALDIDTEIENEYKYEEKLNVLKENIKYIGKLGRYYIFEVEKENVFWNNILFNKYTGEIFTERSGGIYAEWGSIGRGLEYGKMASIINGGKFYITKQ